MTMLLGKKVGMTRVYDESGRLIPVTVIQAGPCTVTQIKTNETDGYSAIQMGFEDVKPSRQTAGRSRPRQEGQHQPEAVRPGMASAREGRSPRTSRATRSRFRSSRTPRSWISSARARARVSRDR